MKRLALIAFSLTVALTQFASAEDNPKVHAKKGAANVGRAPGNAGRARVNVPQGQRSFGTRRGNPGQFRVQHTSAPKFNTGVVNNSRIRGNHVNKATFKHNNPSANVIVNNNRVHNNSWKNNNWKNVNGHGSAEYRNRVVTSQRLRHQNWDRSHHDRAWWTSRYHRFARFGGGYYYWNSGFWYPAYGYDPYFTSYTYDAPVYGYNDLDPGQVIANVQAQLQQSGYYRGSLDGQFGPLTREALVNYQRDNNLPDTGEIDESTLDALGLA